MFRVLARATFLLAVAPPAPVSWWPGARTLPSSVLARLPSSAARAIDRLDVTRLHPTGARLIAIPVDGGRATPRRTPAIPAPVLATPALNAPAPSAMSAPWGEPASPFVGVTVSTCRVPLEWLRPGTTGSLVIQMPVVRTVAMPVASGPPAPVAAGSTPHAAAMAPHAMATAPHAMATAPHAMATAPQATITALPRQMRTWSGAPAVPSRARSHGRFRRAAALVIGLLVSLVAVEAAARSGRR